MNKMSVIKMVLMACLFISWFLNVSCYKEAETVYEALEAFQFPKGILPKGAKGYSLNSDNGVFNVYYGSNCKFGIEAGYQLEYKRTISGIITPGSLDNLRGVKVRVLFVWLTINSVKLVDGQLQFSVGPLSADFPLSNFEESPSCGCGLDCSNNHLPLAES